MYKFVITPNEKNHTIMLPKEFYGKKVEITIVEIVDEANPKPTGKKNFLDDIEAIPDSPGIDEIRSNKK